MIKAIRIYRKRVNEEVHKFVFSTPNRRNQSAAKGIVLTTDQKVWGSNPYVTTKAPQDSCFEGLFYCFFSDIEGLKRIKFKICGVRCIFLSLCF